ncbi:hypothetical protein XELAEV_18017845mg [Xenopus laevis]|uniref:C3H1-type domain-containing protein n=1 Tax=Xenopus laevis TaxID=8355 RepID=A0A974DCD0_XENLA|nr:hypothetical protein XELAEV_18017845mg [Xenopus laevis]
MGALISPQVHGVVHAVMAQFEAGSEELRLLSQSCLQPSPQRITTGAESPPSEEATSPIPPMLQTRAPARPAPFNRYSTRSYKGPAKKKGTVPAKSSAKKKATQSISSFLHSTAVTAQPPTDWPPMTLSASQGRSAPPAGGVSPSAPSTSRVTGHPPTAWPSMSPPATQGRPAPSTRGGNSPTIQSCNTCQSSQEGVGSSRAVAAAAAAAPVPSPTQPVLALKVQTPLREPASVNLLESSTAQDIVKVFLNDKKSESEEDRHRLVARTFTNWLQAFCIYANILCSKHPQLGAILFKHVDIILEAYKSYGGISWFVYEDKFRQKMAVQRSIPWGTKDVDLWMGMMAPRPVINPLGMQKPGQKYNTCWAYNDSACKWQSNCRFKHECFHCGSNHPAFRCVKKFITTPNKLLSKEAGQVDNSGEAVRYASLSKAVPKPQDGGVN